MDLDALTQMGTLGPLPPRSPEGALTPPLEALLPDHLTLVETLGEGGFGRVYRARDERLARDVALKVLLPERAGDPAHTARLVAEARVTAHLEHPAIVAVHELGRLHSGHVYYTMKIVEGERLGAARARRGGEAPDPSGIRRLVGQTLRAVGAVAHAHQRGVAHRDLKPSNILVGDRGAVWVVDWGLARLVDGDEQPRGGTPGYLGPEGDHGPPLSADVYALGATLWRLLVGRTPPPRDGPDRPPELDADLAAAVAGDDDLQMLAAIVRRATADDPADRHPDAGALHAALQEWLEGAHRRTAARRLVARAEEDRGRAARLTAEAARQRQEGEDALSVLPARAPHAAKAPGRALLERARTAQEQAEHFEARAEQRLHRALEQDATSPDARRALAALYQARVVAAEEAGDAAAAARAEAGVRAHDRGEWAAWLKGDGALSVVTEPPGARATLHPLEDHGGRLVEGPPRDLGHTPLRAVPLARGRYVVRLTHAGYAPVVAPIHLRRCEHWDQVAPGETQPTPIVLPPEGELGAGAVYVPPGWCGVGAPGSLERSLPVGRRWVDGFIIERDPVVNGQYCESLNALLDAGREDLALRWVPRERAGGGAKNPQMLYKRDAEGRFYTDFDPDGDPWGPEAPVAMVCWWSAQAYADWRAEVDGKPWRLAWELEWEKAARGVSGRPFPWGALEETTWARCQANNPPVILLPPPDACPEDVSVYGVRAMAGVVRDWCIDPWRAQGWLTSEERRDRVHQRHDVPLPPVDSEDGRVARGGSVFQTLRGALTSRWPGSQTMRRGDVGFRLVRPWPAP